MRAERDRGKSARRSDTQETAIVSVVRDTAVPAVSINDPTSGTGETSFPSISLSGQASDDTRIQSVTWESRVSGSSTGNGSATPTGAGGSWRTWSIANLLLTDDAVNEIKVKATDMFAKESTAIISITRVTNTTSEPGVDLSQTQPPPPADPFDLDGDGYHNDDETGCKGNQT